MFMYNATAATFVISPSNQGTVQVQGTMFRTIPHSSQTPLSADFNYNLGSRWNEPGTYPVLYMSASVAAARAYVEWQSDYFGLLWADMAPEDQPDLLVLTIEASCADVASDSGLTFYGLPKTYPIGYLGPEAWTITRPIGASIYEAGWPGLVTRSATLTSWSGPMSEWAEVALFTEKAPAPLLVDRLAYRDWYLHE
jgi:hypothetical protein